jgi:diguanylate cyclase (GGDEF)-like protein/PAS domain S-box-containing protein
MSSFQDPEIYRAILDGLQIGVSVLDLQKKIVFWSDGAEKITGYTRIEVLGHACTDNILLHCNQVSCEMCSEQCPFADALQGGAPVETMSFIHHKSGYRIGVHTWVIPLRDKRGSMIGLIQTFEGEFAVHGTDPNDRSLKEHGWLDELTGLPNRAMMQSHLRETLGTFAELHVPFGIVCLEASEIDRFRSRYGQQATRSILKVLARTLRNTVWASDVVGTWSEHQFLVILMGCSEESLQAVSVRIHKMLAGASIQWWGEELSVPISLGCAEARAGDTEESILERASKTFGEMKTLPGALTAAASSKGSSS